MADEKKRMDRLRLEVVTPAGRVVDTRVREVYLDTPDGQIGILPEHADLVTLLADGAIWYTADDGRHEAAVDGGSVAVTGGDLVSLATPRLDPTH